MRKLKAVVGDQQQQRQRGGVAVFRPRGRRMRAEEQQKVPTFETHRNVSTRVLAGEVCRTALNFERGAKCRGQGCRHQNPAARSQPKSGGGKQCKWSNPNPARKSDSGAAATTKKNRKAKL